LDRILGLLVPGTEWGITLPITLFLWTNNCLASYEIISHVIIIVYSDGVPWVLANFLLLYNILRVLAEAMSFVT
jgi:hypothetical protein